MTPNNPIDLAAAAWAVQQREGRLAGEARERFEHWLAADSRHLGAYVRIQAVAADLERLSTIAAGKAPSPQTTANRVNALLSRRRIWAIAASALIAIVCVITWQHPFRDGERYVSGVGELRQIALVDGSRMTLNTATVTRVDFSPAERVINLSRGEALFQVAKDPARPFVVHAGRVTVRALGTAFLVRRLGEQVDVTVTAGSVQVIDETARNARPKVLRAHEQVTATNVGFIKAEPVPQEAIDRALSWREGMVSFNGESLAEAAAVLNRHNRRQLTIDDPRIAGEPIIGMFRAEDIESFARTAAAITNARVIDEGPRLRLEAEPTN